MKFRLFVIILMNILLVTQYYPPEPGSASMRMGEVAEYLAGKGHGVTVMTGFPNYPNGKVYDGYKMRLVSREIVKLGNREIVKRRECRGEKSEAGEKCKGDGGGEIETIRVPLYTTSKRRSFKH